MKPDLQKITKLNLDADSRAMRYRTFEAYTSDMKIIDRAKFLTLIKLLDARFYLKHIRPIKDNLKFNSYCTPTHLIFKDNKGIHYFFTHNFSK